MADREWLAERLQQNRGAAAGESRSRSDPRLRLSSGDGEEMSRMGSKNTQAGRTTSSAEPACLQVKPIGVIRSVIKERSKAPKQGSEGAPDAWIVVRPSMARAVDGLAAGDQIVVLTWLHRAQRDVLKVHPRSDPKRRLTGVFATRSPDRPNPIGLHEVTVRKVAKTRLRVGPIEAIDGTPVIDIKPILGTPRPSEKGSDESFLAGAVERR